MHCQSLWEKCLLNTKIIWLHTFFKIFILFSAKESQTCIKLNEGEFNEKISIYKCTIPLNGFLCPQQDHSFDQLSPNFLPLIKILFGFLFTFTSEMFTYMNSV